MTNFEKKGVQKQEEAYCVSFAKKQLGYSCKSCCEKGLRHTRCDICPIQQAHNKAIKEIQKGLRKKPVKISKSYGDATYKVVINGNVYITRTLIIK